MLSAIAALLLAAGPRTFTFAAATAEHPRHSEGAVIELKDGSLFVAWQQYRAGHKGDSDFAPNDIYGARSADGGRTWGEKRLVVPTPKGFINVYSPGLQRLPTGEIVLTWMRNHPFEKAGDKVYPPTSAECWVSADEARTWSPRGTMWTEVPAQFASSTLKRLKSGRLLQPVSRDFGSKAKGDAWRGGAAYSDDGGRTWALSTAYAEVPKRGAMEPQVEELRDGRLLMVVRTQLGTLYRSFSADGGATWSAGESTGLPAPESCPCLARVPSTGDLLLVWNNVYDPKGRSHGGKRTPLVAAVSKDDGKTWGTPRAVETDPARAFTNPGVAFTSKNQAVLNYWSSAYTPSGLMGDDRIDLKLAVIDVPWFYGE